MNILIIGAYGLIGSGIARRLDRDGHHVTGLGRNITLGQTILPFADWQKGDLRNLDDVSDWMPFLQGVDLVVNCSGALQDGPQDDLEAVHHHAIAALAKACAKSDIGLVQISAIGVSAQATTEFLTSKARGDEAVRQSGAAYHILKPGLVLAPQSYGGTTLLRMLAAFPWLQPIAFRGAEFQTVSLDDLAGVVSAIVDGKIPVGFEGNIVEGSIHSLRHIVQTTRTWLGFDAAKLEFGLPKFLAYGMARLADGLGRLGWRSPLRTTSMKVLADGVTGAPADLSAFGLNPIRSLEQSLREMPARLEDRIAARMALLTPVILFSLFLLWFLSGAIGLVRVTSAAEVLVNAGWGKSLAVASVVFWSLVDLLIAFGLAYRPYAKTACWASVGVCLFYLLSSSVFVPDLWLDPLGALVKVFPAITLSLVARVVLETR